MDIVYLTKRTENENLALRFSLRSLKNIKHDKVWLIGYTPPRTENIFKIEMTDGEHKFKNVANKLKEICDHDEISEDFIFMHDDIFILKTLSTIPYRTRGSLKDHKEIIKNKFGENEYYRSINAVYQKFKRGKSFDLHAPIIFNRKKLKEIFEKYPGKSGSKRSIYCNHFKIKGESFHGGEDCKIYGEKLEIKKDREVFSSSDLVEKSGRFYNYLQETFQDPSPYESLSFKYNHMDKVNVSILRSLYPYRAGESVLMKKEIAEKREKKGYLKIVSLKNQAKKEKLDNEIKKTTKKMMTKPKANKSMAKRSYMRKKAL